MMKWEYKTIEIVTPQGLFGDPHKQLKPSVIDEKLNLLGKEGWELVMVFNASPTGVAEVTMAILKRQLQ